MRFEIRKWKLEKDSEAILMHAFVHKINISINDAGIIDDV